MKVVEFGLNESSTEERLDSGWSKLDLVNGTGEYLGILRVGSKKFLITRTLSSGRGEYNNRIMVNEIESDLFASGSETFYFNVDKPIEAKQLEEKLNNPEIRKQLLKGKKIRELLGFTSFQYYTALADSVENKFVKYDENEELIVTGIPGKYFEKLKESKKTPITVYQMCHEIERLKKELNDKESKK